MTPFSWKLKAFQRNNSKKTIQISKTAIYVCFTFYQLFDCPMTNFGPLLQGQPHSSDINTKSLSIFLSWELPLFPHVLTQALPIKFWRAPHPSHLATVNTPVGNPVYTLPLRTSMTVSPSISSNTIFQCKSVIVCWCIIFSFLKNFKTQNFTITKKKHIYTWITDSKTHTWAYWI